MKKKLICIRVSERLLLQYRELCEENCTTISDRISNILCLDMKRGIKK
jgi:hypothetical protein